MTISDARDRAGSSHTAWRRIAEALQAGIGDGTYPPGCTLPASVELAGQYGVHRHTIRQAFRHLAEQGLVRVERGRGTQVLPQRFPYRIGRRVSLRANFGAAGMEVTGRIINQAIIEAPASVREALLLPNGARIWRIRTMNMAEGVPVSSGVHALDAARFPDFPRVLAETGVSITAALKACGIDGYNRLSTRLSARLASAREADLLQIAEDSPVLQSIGLDGLTDLTPIHLVEGVFVGERMEMIVAPFSDD